MPVPVAVLNFETGSAMLPIDHLERIKPALEAAAAKSGAKLSISGFHDASGDLAMNQELAKQRAIAVAGALKAAGLNEGRIVLAKPQQTQGSGNPDAARRVEIVIVE